MCREVLLNINHVQGIPVYSVVFSRYAGIEIRTTTKDIIVRLWTKYNGEEYLCKKKKPIVLKDPFDYTACARVLLKIGEEILPYIQAVVNKNHSK